MPAGRLAGWPAAGPSGRPAGRVRPPVSSRLARYSLQCVKAGGVSRDTLCNLGRQGAFRAILFAICEGRGRLARYSLQFAKQHLLFLIRFFYFFGRPYAGLASWQAKVRPAGRPAGRFYFLQAFFISSVVRIRWAGRLAGQGPSGRPAG